MKPAEQISNFLENNPHGPLWVVVGFASAYGLRWLNQRTKGRNVNLLIGDTRTGFTHYKEQDRVGAVDFLNRSDVSVKNWYQRRGGHRTAHAKAWMVQPDPEVGVAGAVLVGSANLTQAGLFRNAEILALAAESEHLRLREEMRNLMEAGWSCKERLLGKLAVNARNKVRSRRQDVPKRRSTTDTLVSGLSEKKERARKLATVAFALSLCSIALARVPVLNFLVCATGLVLSRVSLFRVPGRSLHRALALIGLGASTVAAGMTQYEILVIAAVVVWVLLYWKAKRSSR